MSGFDIYDYSAFLAYLRDNRGYSTNTIITYERVLKYALKNSEIYVDDEQIVLDLMPYRLQIKEQKPTTISKKLSAVRSYVEYLQENGVAVKLKNDDSIKVPKTLPKPIAHKQIQQALELASEQEKLVIVLLYSLGLRISELQTLRLEDISSQWVRVLGKGDKQRDIPLLAQTYELIQSYIASHQPKVYLFEKNEQLLSQNTLRYIIHKVFQRVGLKVTPHQLRHSFATELLNASAPIADVSEMLGHASMATTQIYTKLGSALKLQNYKKAHPLSGEK